MFKRLSDVADQLDCGLCRRRAGAEQQGEDEYNGREDARPGSLEASNCALYSCQTSSTGLDWIGIQWVSFLCGLETRGLCLGADPLTK